MEKQLDILKYVIEELRLDKSVTGIMLMGSVAYENASDDSDLDILVLCNEDKFVSKYIENIFVEIHFQKYNTMLKKLKSNPIEVYKYIYSKILFDDGKLNKLCFKANEIYDSYITPINEINGIKYWLSSTKTKLISAIKYNDMEKVSYIISTNSWKLLEGIWALNNKPMPPSSIAFNKYDVLNHIPSENWFNDLFVGDIISRSKTFINIIDWICNQ
ncbi:MAG: nucleotidyltransferase domain-containing protein [Clostridia bacterium]|nr:nucleotidyltransferase domain-containing protein [Clostridia bacterium]